MHDPMTVVFDIRSPFREKPSKLWPKGYRNTLITIWHVDPETDGSDDSCGWFMRARHGDPKVLAKIRSRFEFDWDSDHGGWFDKQGKPLFSPMGIALQMFYAAAWEHFGHDRDRAVKFISRNLTDILMFAENPVDSIHGSIIGRWGPTPREERIEQFASVIYSWILRAERPWWRHPKWHVHHWKIQIHHYQAFLRWAFTRCSACGGRFKWGETGVSNQWHSDGPRWFRSEELVHCRCQPNGVPAQSAGGSAP